MQAKPCYFRDVKNGGLFRYKDEIWLKVIPSTYWVNDNLSQKEYDFLMKNFPNAICPNPIDIKDDEIGMRSNFISANELVEELW